MYYLNAPEKNEKKSWIVTNRTANEIFEETSFIIFTLSNSGKRKAQKMHFTNANTNNEKV